MRLLEVYKKLEEKPRTDSPIEVTGKDIDALVVEVLV